jgi:hypothetical protein
MEQISFAICRARKASSEGSEVGKDTKLALEITS